MAFQHLIHGLTRHTQRRIVERALGKHCGVTGRVQQDVAFAQGHIQLLAGRSTISRLGC